MTLSGIGLYTFVAIRGLSIQVRLNVYYPKSKRDPPSPVVNSSSLASLQADVRSKPDRQSHDPVRNSSQLKTIPSLFPDPSLENYTIHSPIEHENRNLNASHPPIHPIPDIVGIMQEAALCTPAVYAILGMIEAVNFGRYEDDDH